MSRNLFRIRHLTASASRWSLLRRSPRQGKPTLPRTAGMPPFTICDDCGHLVLLHGMSIPQLGSLDLALSKARAAAFRRPTSIFRDDLAAGKFNTLLASAAGTRHSSGASLSDNRRWQGGRRHRRFRCNEALLACLMGQSRALAGLKVLENRR